MLIVVFKVLTIDCLLCFTIPPPVSVKKIVMEGFTKLDSKLTVIFCTSAFGSGVNVPDIDMIINGGRHGPLRSSCRSLGGVAEMGEVQCLCYIIMV